LYNFMTLNFLFSLIFYGDKKSESYNKETNYTMINLKEKIEKTYWNA
jgi:hypothetical protein